MKILLLGKNGQVGWELQRTLGTLGQIIAVDLEDLDLVDECAIRTKVQEIKPGLIVNASAYTAVDKAEEDRDLAYAINSKAPQILAEEAKKLNIGIVHYSTDYVFDGTNTIPYTEEDQTSPLGIYGETKLSGEKAIIDTGVPYLIFRTSWVYGSRGKNFLLTILRLAKEREKLGIVSDQIGSPTWSRMIAEVTAQVLAQGIKNIPEFLAEKGGVYNLTGSGFTTWFSFAEKFLNSKLVDESYRIKHLEPITTSEYPTPAKRPAYSVLSNDKLRKVFGIQTMSWDSALDLVIEEIANS